MIPKQNVEPKTNLPFLNAKVITSNMDKVIQFYHEPNLLITKENRKKHLFNALNSIQNTQIPSKEGSVIIQFENKSICNHFIKNHMFPAEATKGDMHLFNEQERKKITYNIKKALELIQILHPHLHSLINLLIGTICCFKVKGLGGGSLSSTIGLIWLNPQKKWSVIDYADYIYHEFIHNSLFFDDMVNCIFPDPNACGEEEALVLSPIRKEKRALDRSFHATGVAIGLMHYYQLLSDEKKSMDFLPDVRKTISQLNERTSYLGPRGKETLEAMNNFILYLDYESITESLNIE